MNSGQQTQSIASFFEEESLSLSVRARLCAIGLGLLCAAFSLWGAAFLALENHVGVSNAGRKVFRLITVPKQQEVQIRSRQRPEPPQPAEPLTPIAPPKAETQNVTMKPMKMALIRPKLSVVSSVRVDVGVSAGTAARGLIPTYRVLPQYPYKARQRGIEGVVEVEFTITAAGSVTDTTVLSANPPHVFDRAAKHAISRWRYKPKISGGKAVAQRAVQEIVFQLEGR